MELIHILLLQMTYIFYWSFGSPFQQMCSRANTSQTENQSRSLTVHSSHLAVVMDPEKEEPSLFTWQILSDDIILNIFYYLPAPTVFKVSQVCKTWYRVAFDEILWKNLFHRHWKIPRSKAIAAGKESWVQEYKRLHFHTPAVDSEVLRSHTDEVLRVCFSHNGKMFATSSKDGFIKVWNSSYPCSLKYEADMRKYACAHTWFSQFNESDTLLLVAGVYDRNLARGGEIVVFSLQEGFRMQRQVINESDQVLGTWYNDSYFLSGNVSHIGTVTSSSTIWLNQAHKKTESEQESSSMCLFRFLNENNNCAGSITIANVVDDKTGSLYKTSSGTTSTSQGKDNAAKVVHSATDNGQVYTGKYSSYPSQRSRVTVPVNERSRSLQDQEIDLDPNTNNYESDFTSGLDTNDSLCKTSIDLGSWNSRKTHTGCSHSFSFKGTLDFKPTTSEVEDKLASTSIFDDVSVQMSSGAPMGQSDLMKEGRSLFCRQCLNDSQLKVLGPDSTDHGSEKESDMKMFQRKTCQYHAAVNAVDKMSVKAEMLCFPSDSDIQRNVIFSVNPNVEVFPDVSTCAEIPSNGNNFDVSVTPKLVDPTCDEQFQHYPFSDDDIDNNESCENNVNISVPSVDNNNESCESDVSISGPSVDNNNESCESDVNISGPSVDNNKSIKTSKNDSTFSWNSVANKYLIFKRGSETCIPHEIGIKLIQARKYFHPVTNQLLTDAPDNLHSMESDTYDNSEYNFNMHGHIIGMCLSPDHRYLYVNSRPWLKGSQIENLMDLPPLAKEIEIHIIDLVTLKELDKMQTSQKARMPGNSYIEIDLDVSQEYVASGAEDKNGYLWDRHYGICINKFQHSDIVNSVAFNPADPEMLVSVSDDRSIKVWRSLNRENMLNKTAARAALEAGDTPTIKH